MARGIGGHSVAVRGETDDWLTPPALLHALGRFDLDPCACEAQPWHTADEMVSPPDDGLLREWKGRVWLNPPYGPTAERWLEKLADHGDGISLIFARTDTRWFHRVVFGRASALYFLRGRIRFRRPDGRSGKYTSGAPSVLVSYDRLGKSRNLNTFLCLPRTVPGRFISLR